MTKVFILDAYRGVYDKQMAPYSGCLTTRAFETFDDALEYVEIFLKRREDVEIACYFDIINVENRLRRLYVLKSENGYETLTTTINCEIVF